MLLFAKAFTCHSSVTIDCLYQTFCPDTTILLQCSDHMIGTIYKLMAVVRFDVCVIIFYVFQSKGEVSFIL
jgi:hypothetical protein